MGRDNSYVEEINMQKSLLQEISRIYKVKILNHSEAPRQFVAETWFIDTDKGKYFVKIVDKELFIPEIIRSLPVVEALHKQGVDRISWPVTTASGELFTTIEGKLTILFNFLDAPQSYDYNEAALGELLGQIHRVSEVITPKIPEETFVFTYASTFEHQFEGILSGDLAKDKILKEMQQLLKLYESRIRMQYHRLNELMEGVAQLKLPFVITHGDAGGNTLVKSADDIYLIDWDGLLWAPAERDIWVPTHNFMEGYRKQRPDFTVNTISRDYYTVIYYFRSMAQYFAEIISNKNNSHREQNLKELKENLLEGWMVDYLIRSGAY